MADQERRPEQHAVTRSGDRPLCECCDPRRPLALRPDFGLVADGSAKYAVCVARQPFVVHVNRGDGTWEKRDELTLSSDGSTISGPDAFVAVTARGPVAEGLRRAGLLGGARPSTVTGERVDLTQDEHYRSGP
jgi:hypothetical protein